MADNTPAKQTRIYFCRPCDRWHPAPTNAKCKRSEAEREDRPTGNESTGDVTPAKRGKNTRISKRQRQPSNSPSSPEQQATVKEKATGRRKRTRISYQVEPIEDRQSEVGPSLDLILQRLDAISSESRHAREEMAKEAKADREEIRKSISEIKSRPVHSTSHANASNVATGDSEDNGDAGITPEALSRSANQMRTLRQDRPSAVIANAALQPRPTQVDENGSKKLKSGFLLTINDQVHVQAQWPQLNVFRATKNLATYDSLSVNEFCSGYIVFVKDYLVSDKPNLDVALDDLNYLTDLIDEIPLMGWETVRSAHGEVLRLIEQDRLKPYAGLTWKSWQRRRLVQSQILSPPGRKNHVKVIKLTSALKRTLTVQIQLRGCIAVPHATR